MRPIIIGASWGGLVCGAALAKSGIPALVLESSPLVGGRTAHQHFEGYTIDLGHRDAMGPGDPLLMMSRTAKAAVAAETGVDLTNVEPIRPKLTIHHAPSQSVVILDGSTTPIEDLARKVLGVRDEVIPAFLAEVKTLKSLSADAVASLIPVSFEEWLKTHDDAEVREAFNRWAAAEWLVPQSHTSFGRFVQMLQSPDLEYIVAPDGAGAFAQPFADAIEAAGGEVRTDVELLEILVSDGAISGVVVRDRFGFIETLESDAVVFCNPPGDVLSVVPDGVLSRDFVDVVSAQEQWAGFPGSGAYFALSELPHRASDGAPEDHAGWHRLLNIADDGSGEYAGGWMLTTLGRPDRAPVGKHLIWAGCAHHSPITHHDAVAAMDLVHDYLRRYYDDFDRIVEWRRTQLITPHFSKGYAWKTDPRPSHRSADVDGLWFVDCAVESESFYFYDVDAELALRVAGEVGASRPVR